MDYSDFMGALAVWREARGECADAKVGVARVIVNRARDGKRWPNMIEDVVTQKGQFSSFAIGDPNATKFPSKRIPADWAAWTESIHAIQIALTHGAPDPVDGATFYHDSSIPRPPGWKKLGFTKQIGHLLFYGIDKKI